MGKFKGDWFDLVEERLSRDLSLIGDFDLDLNRLLKSLTLAEFDTLLIVYCLLKDLEEEVWLLPILSEEKILCLNSFSLKLTSRLMFLNF